MTIDEIMKKIGTVPLCEMADSNGAFKMPFNYDEFCIMLKGTEFENDSDDLKKAMYAGVENRIHWKYYCLTKRNK